MNEEKLKEFIEIFEKLLYPNTRNKKEIFFNMLKIMDENNFSNEEKEKVINTITTYLTQNNDPIDSALLQEYSQAKFPSLFYCVADYELQNGNLFFGTKDTPSAYDLAITTISQLRDFGLIVDPYIIKAKISMDKEKFYLNSEFGILKFIPRKGFDKVSDWYITQVIENISDMKELQSIPTYNITFQNKFETLTFEDLPLQDIVTRLQNYKGIQNQKELFPAISSIIYELSPHIQKRIYIPITGLYELNDGSLNFNISQKFPVNLNPNRANKEEAVKALNKFLELLSFFDKEKATYILYYYLAAPFAQVFKKHSKEFHILLIYGEPHTGKTTITKLFSAVYGISENEGAIGTKNLSIAQLSRLLNSTTFPILFDEMQTNTLEDFAEVFKIATTSFRIRRIIKKEGEADFFAFAPIVIATNKIFCNDEALQKRIYAITFSKKDIKTEEEVRGFFNKLNTYKAELYPLGDYLINMYLRRWGEIKPILLNSNEFVLGRALVNMLFTELGIQNPYYTEQIQLEKFSIEEEDFEQQFYSAIRENLTEIITKTLKNFQASWDERLEDLKRNNLLPSYLFVGSEYIKITNDILRLLDKKDINFSGDLKVLSEKLEKAQFSPARAGKTTIRCIVILRKVFIEKLAGTEPETQPAEEQPQQPQQSQQSPQPQPPTTNQKKDWKTYELILTKIASLPTFLASNETHWQILSNLTLISVPTLKEKCKELEEMGYLLREPLGDGKVRLVVVKKGGENE